MARGENAEAEASFRKAIDAAPKSVEARLALGNYLWVNGRTEEAEQQLKEGEKLAPSDDSVQRALAMMYIATNRPERAEANLKAVAKARNTPAAFLRLSDYYVHMKRFDEARTLLNEIANDQRARTAVTIRLAGINASTGARSEAIRSLRELVANQPKEPSARFVLARLLVDDGKVEEAMSLAKSVVSDAPDSPMAPETYMIIGKIHAAMGRTGEAIKAFEEALRRQPQPLGPALALASAHLSLGAFDQTNTYIQQALTIQPRNSDARRLKVRMLIQQNDLRKAREELTALQKDFPNAFPVVMLTGDLQLAEKQIAAARASFERAATVAPYDPDVVSGLVKTDLASGRPKDAVGRIEKALKVSQTPGLVLLAATTYVAAGDPEKAETMFIKAIELQPARVQAYTLLGSFYIGQQRNPDAIDRFQDAIERDPNSVPAHTMLGMLYEMRQRPADAEKQYRKALEIDATASLAANNLAWMYVSGNRNLDEALQLAQQAKQNQPDDPEIDDTLGWIYYRKDRTKLAIEHLERAAARGPDVPARHYHLGLAYFRAGDFDRAKASLKHALSLKQEFDGIEEARKTLAQLGS